MKYRISFYGLIRMLKKGIRRNLEKDLGYVQTTFQQPAKDPRKIVTLKQR